MGLVLFLWCICEFVAKMKPINARRIEILGYYFLFVLLVWELILKGIMMKEYYEGDVFYLTQKINHMFEFIQANTGFSAVDPQVTIDQFDAIVPGKRVQTQMKGVDFIEAGLTILSTVFIVAGRFYELRHLKDKEEKLS